MLWFKSETVLPCFLRGVLWCHVLDWVFKPFWVYFCLWREYVCKIYGVSMCAKFHAANQLSQHHLLKGLSFSIVYPGLLCWRSVVHRSVGLFLGSMLFCWSVCVVLGQCHPVLITVLFQCCLKSGRAANPALFLSLGLLWQFWIFSYFHINFRIIKFI